MTDYAAMVTALYRKLGRWRLVAEACNDGAAHSAGYYQQIARGRIKTPDARTAERIACVFSAFSAPRTRDARKTVHLCFDDLEAGNSERKRIGATWPEMVHLWRLAYEEVGR